MVKTTPPRSPHLPDWRHALSDAHLSRRAGINVFARGQTYAASSAVQEAELAYPQDGACIELRATVMGTQPYACTLQVSGEDALAGDCDCPHAQDGYFCKHQVALGLTLRGLLGGDAPVHDPKAQAKVAAAAKRAQTQARNRETLQAFVQAQSATALAERLWAWAELDRDLMADLKSWAAQSRAGDDPEAVKAAISELLKSSGFLDWRASGVYAQRAAKVLPLLQQALQADAAHARRLCEHALHRLYRACGDADDSNGQIGDVLHAVKDVLLQCLRAAPPDASWVDDWFALMQADPWGLWRESEVFDAAGPAVQQAYGRHAEKAWFAWLKAHPPTPTDRTPYDHERAQLRRRYLDVLKSRGDTQAVIDVMRSHLAGAMEHDDLVTYCEAQGRPREALAFAQAAHKLFPRDLRCEETLLRCYERDGWDEEALALHRQRLERRPSVEHYQALLKAAQAAGRDAVACRAELFAWAETRETAPPPRARAWPGSTPDGQREVSTRAEWLLCEGRIDEALALVQAPHRVSVDLLRRLALRLPALQHDQAVPLLMRVFDAGMPGASTPYRNELDLVRETASRMPMPECSQWLARLRGQYKAKRNFIKGLDALAFDVPGR